MNNKYIIVVTDCRDVAMEQIKARLTKNLLKKSIHPNFFCIYVSPFQINSGIFLSKLIYNEIPLGSDTLFLAIVNPLRTKPKRIYGQLNNGAWFIGADTGIFSSLFEDSGIRNVWEASFQGHYPFGGLHVHSVTAGNLLCNVSPDKMGNKIKREDVKKIQPSFGEVVYIDNFGLIKIWAKAKDYNFKEGEEIDINFLNNKKKLKNRKKGFYSHRMMNYDNDSLVVYPGSSLLDEMKINNVDEYSKSGLIEIGLVRNLNTAKSLKVNIGDILELNSAK